MHNYRSTPIQRIKQWVKHVGWQYILIGIVTLVLRIADLGRFLTHDEAEFWFTRSDSLIKALQSGDYGSMAISTHPGVTTMWLGAAGLELRRFLFDHALLHHETITTILTLQRLPIALAHVVGILVGFALLRRLFPPTLAFLAAFLWATDPFVIGYSRLLHVDAIAGTFATLSLLAAAIGWKYSSSDSPSPPLSPSRWWLALSGVMAGLAVLSKSPAIALLPTVALFAWISLHNHTRWRRIAAAAMQVGVWGAAATVTAFVVWPALWAAPMEVYEAMHAGVAIEGAQPHMTGNFFLGETNPAPGLRYYPVSLVLRMTPWSLIGVLLIAVAWKRFPPSTRRTLALLTTFIIIFTVGLSVFPKKFNRYLVPVFPAVDMLAAAGWVGTFSLLAPWASPLAQKLRAMRIRHTGMLPVGMLCAVAIINSWWWHPYSITAFNQLLGGAEAGAHNLAVGWGEGLEQVAAWLNEQPDITDVLTISHMITSLDPFLKEGARATFPDQGRLKAGAGYVVTYIYQVQGGNPPPPFDALYGTMTPLHTITIHGVDYAWVYDAPPLLGEPPLAATIGDAIYLWGAEQKIPPRRGHEAVSTLAWHALKPVPEDYWLFAHLIGEDGQRYAQIDQPYPTSTWQAGRFVRTEMVMSIPEGLPAGAYAVVVGMYEKQTQRRLYVRQEHGQIEAIPFADAVQGENVVVVWRGDIGRQKGVGD